MSLSFLPLSHSFERLVSYVYLAHGVTIVFAESMDTIGRDMLIVRPTVMTGVPRVYEKFQARILERGACAAAAAADAVPLGREGRAWRAAARRARTAARPAAARARDGARRPAGVLEDPRERRRAAARASCRAARRCRCDVAEFFAGIGLPITEGYGLTETSPIVTRQSDRTRRALGTVGKPIPGVEVRIAEDGEILVRGPNVMMGYYNKPAETAAVLRDGWFHTGDIGALDADGYLTITDRKKDLLVTSGGKKIAPQPIEAVLKTQPARRRGRACSAIVAASSSALIVPDFAALERRLKDLGRPPGRPRRRSSAATTSSRSTRRSSTALNRELSQFERIKKFRLLPREFTIEAGELTPTMKVKRQGGRAELARGDRAAVYLAGC